MPDRSKYTFAISLSVLNHLGRNLYRSFSTVLGEAISNSWDAEADNVWIYVDREKNILVVKDDGIGMTENDFQTKFLKIGYSKRKDGQSTSEKKGRPFIGRKGIGKLALLSCAKKISVLSKHAGGDFIGGSIDNNGLDEAIFHDLTPDKYSLEEVEGKDFDPYVQGLSHGTIIIFQDLNDGIKHSLEFLRKNIALYFRFSLKDSSFNIFLNDEKITLHDLKALTDKTQFLWTINGFSDPFVDNHLTELKERLDLPATGNIEGFIASVERPTNLRIFTTEERVTIDLFVNGRLREKNILKHVPTARLVESYLYGQVHFDDLDDEVDRFTSSREGIVANDPIFKELLNTLSKEVLNKVFEIWDEWRVKHKETGDEENPRLTRRERKSGELFNEVAKDYSQEEDSPNKEKVHGWIDSLAGDASFNFGSYAECFVSENLVRLYLKDKNHNLSTHAQKEIKDRADKESKNKETANMSIDLRQNNDVLSFLGMFSLASEVEGKSDSQQGALGDAIQYRPIRDALMHTALLTDQAKKKLTTVYENIRGRIQTLLSSAE